MTLVALTPIGLDAGCWRQVRLPDDAILHEYPGHGRRAGIPGSLDELAREVLALPVPGPLDLLGISMGGMVALHAALLAPARVRSLLLCCTNAGGRGATMAERAEAVQRGGIAAVLASTLERWFTASALADPGHGGVAYARRTLLELDPATFAAGWRAIAGHDVRDRLSEITSVCSCVAAADDRASPPAVVRELAAAIPGAELVAVDGPHMLSLECPETVSITLAGHLERVADR